MKLEEKAQYLKDVCKLDYIDEWNYWPRWKKKLRKLDINTKSTLIAVPLMLGYFLLFDKTMKPNELILLTIPLMTLTQFGVIYSLYQNDISRIKTNERINELEKEINETYKLKTKEINNYLKEKYQPNLLLEHKH